MDAVKNFAKVEVSQGYDAAATSIVLDTDEGAKLPGPSTDGQFNLVWWNSTDFPDPADDPNREIVRCTARSTDTLTVVRDQEGSGASTKNEGGKTYHMILGLTKKMMDDIKTKKANVPDRIEEETTNEVTPNGSNQETEVFISALTDSPLTLKDPTGTPADGHTIVFQITASGAKRNLTWETDYKVLFADLPDDVEQDETVVVMFAYFNSQWNSMSVLEE